MAMPATPSTRQYTVEEVYAWPDDGIRYEVVHGELLVTPSPRAVHQSVVMQLLARLHEYLKPLGLERTLFPGPADIFWGDDVWVQPDMLVVVPEEVSTDWRTYKSLRLVVEVLSHTSTRGDRVVKRAAYQENRVATYWIVDADRRVVEVWHPEDEAPELVTDVLRWRVTADAPELAIALREVWESMPR
jgi:Uma2 family endonuclease